MYDTDPCETPLVVSLNCENLFLRDFSHTNFFNHVRRFSSILWQVSSRNCGEETPNRSIFGKPNSYIYYLPYPHTC